MTLVKPDKNFRKLNRMSQDPVHEFEGNWYFWNETWDKRIGSYISRVGAEEGLRVYLEELESKREDEKFYKNNPNATDFEPKTKIKKDEFDEPYP